MTNAQIDRKLPSGWPKAKKELFRCLYRLFLEQRLFVHPKAERVPREHWNTIAWNTAWMAVEIVYEEPPE